MTSSVRLRARSAASSLLQLLQVLLLPLLLARRNSALLGMSAQLFARGCAHPRLLLVVVCSSRVMSGRPGREGRREEEKEWERRDLRACGRT